MPKGFEPGIDAARIALGTSTPIVHNIHPGGAKGVNLSLKEVAARIRKGRIDPRIRAWAIRAIKKDGGPQDTIGQAQAILTALKDATVYVQDPANAEFMQAAHETLCLDDKGLCFRGGDCDDLVIAYGSATLSVGIPTKIIGECFNNNPTPSHVLAAIQNTANGEWLRVDPSTNKPVGEYVAGTKEVWIDPMEDNSTSLSGAEPSGDFVGVGKITYLGSGQDPSAPPTPDGIPIPNSTYWIIGGLSLAAVGGLIYLQNRKV